MTPSPAPAEPDTPHNGGAPTPPNGAANSTRTGAPATEGQSDRAVRRRTGLALTLGAVAQVALYLFAGRNVVGPTLHPDGDGYLLIARIIAGGPEASIFEARTIGYPLLIAPVYWFVDDPYSVFRGVQMVNAGLIVATFLLTYLFGRRVLGMRPLLAGATAGVATSLPAAHLFGLLVLTEAAFTPAVVGWLLLLHGWLVNTHTVDRRRTWLAVGAGACTTYLYLVHSRALVLVALYLAVVAVLALLRWVRPWDAAASIGGLVGVFLIGSLVNRWVGDRAYPEPLGSIMDRPIQGLTTVPGMVRSISDGAGQVWYLMLSTWGMAAVGVAFAATLTYRSLARTSPVRHGEIGDGDERREVVRARLAVVVVVLLSTIAVALTTAAALPDENRVGNHMYGRYLSQFTTVWVMIGLGALLNAGWRRAAVLVAQGTALVLVTCYMVLAYAGTDVGREAYYAVDLPEVSLLGGSFSSLHMARASVMALFLLTCVTLATALPKRTLVRVTAAGLVGVAVASAAATVYLGRTIAEIPSDRQYGEHTTELVRDAGARPGDVVVASTDLDWAVLIMQQREIYWTAVRRFDARHPVPPGLPSNSRLYRFRDIPADTTLYIAPWEDRRGRDWDGTKWGWRMIVFDERRQFAVWRRA